MNKTIKQTVTAGILVLSLTAPLVHPTDAGAASVKLNKKKLTLSKGNSYRLKLKGYSGKVTWKSSSKKTATVNKKGTVKAKKAGRAKITAKVKIKGRTKKLYCQVTVRKKAGAPVKPTPTNTPAASRPPVTTVRPTATKKPVIQQKPNVTWRPEATKRPAATIKPSATPKPSATNPPSSSGVTEQSAYATLNSLRSTYPEGMPLTNSYYYYSPRFGNGYGCYGFAAKLSDTVFGTERAYTTHSSFDKIRVGDNIRIGNSHSVIVLTKESNHITVVEGNYNSSVHWDRKITASSLASSGFKVYTRY